MKRKRASSAASFKKVGRAKRPKASKTVEEVRRAGNLKAGQTRLESEDKSETDGPEYPMDVIDNDSDQESSTSRDSSETPQREDFADEDPNEGDEASDGEKEENAEHDEQSSDESKENISLDKESSGSWKTLCRDEAALVRVFNLIPYNIYTGWDRQRTREDRENAGAESDPGEGNRKAKESGRISPKKSAKKRTEKTSNQELHERLQKKIVELRATRMADDEKAIITRENRKRKREAKRVSNSKQTREKRKKQILSKRPDTSPEQVDELGFGRITGLGGDKQKKGKIAKKKGLESHLREAEAGKLKETELRSEGTEEAIRTLKKARMEKAVLKAQGIVVRDDPKRIKKSMKAQKRNKEKSKERWEERKKEQQEEKQARQETRQKNLKGRKAAGKDRKNKKKGAKKKAKT